MSGQASKPEALDAFTRAYIECALWSSTDDAGEPLDMYDVDDIDPKTLAEMEADCKDFQDANGPMIASDPTCAGHDFWLTRNRHGAGFWDGDWPSADGQILTANSHAYGEFNLYVGDDGRIHG